jgi:hypothetical protein
MRANGDSIAREPRAMAVTGAVAQRRCTSCVPDGMDCTGCRPWVRFEGPLYLDGPSGASNRLRHVEIVTLERPHGFPNSFGPRWSDTSRGLKPPKVRTVRQIEAAVVSSPSLSRAAGEEVRMEELNPKVKESI